MFARMLLRAVLGLAVLEIGSGSLVVAAEVEVIRDNDGPGTSFRGDWRFSFFGRDDYGPHSRFADDDEEGWYRFQMDLPEPGEYEVYLWWIKDSHLSHRVPVDIEHRGGVSAVEGRPAQRRRQVESRRDLEVWRRGDDHDPRAG